MNIGRAERRLRRVGGWAAILAAFGSGVALVMIGADPLWRLTVFFPLLAGGIGVIQAREGT